jgi:hypothetical protein
MIEPFITVRRYPYEEPYLTQLRFFVSNGFFSGATDIYCDVEEIAAIGTALEFFPKKVSDEYTYEYGSEDPAKEFYRYFLLRAYTTDQAGHCALQIHINLNEKEPEEGVCKFSMRAEPAAINRLGKLFMSFSKLAHLEFHWNLIEGHLHEQHQLADSF